MLGTEWSDGYASLLFVSLCLRFVLWYARYCFVLSLRGGALEVLSNSIDSQKNESVPKTGGDEGALRVLRTIGIGRMGAAIGSCGGFAKVKQHPVLARIYCPYTGIG